MCHRVPSHADRSAFRSWSVFLHLTCNKKIERLVGRSFVFILAPQPLNSLPLLWCFCFFLHNLAQETERSNKETDEIQHEKACDKIKYTQNNCPGHRVLNNIHLTTPNKVSMIPPATAVPSTPARLGPMACMIRKLRLLA
jgi:hypothetical protein